MSKRKREITIAIAITAKGPGIAEMEATIDRMLDAGTIQDAIAEACADRGLTIEITRAMCMEES